VSVNIFRAHKRSLVRGFHSFQKFSDPQL